MIKHVLDFFRPENMRVDIVTKSFNKSHGEFFFHVSNRVLWKNLFHASNIFHLQNLIL